LTSWLTCTARAGLVVESCSEALLSVAIATPFLGDSIIPRKGRPPPQTKVTTRPCGRDICHYSVNTAPLAGANFAISLYQPSRETMPPDEFAELFDGENHERDAAEVEVFAPTQWCGVEHGLQNRYFGDEHQQHDFGRIAIHLPTAVGGGHVIVAHVMVRFGFV